MLHGQLSFVISNLRSRADNHDPTVQPARVGLLELQLGKAQESHCRLSAPWRCGLLANSSWVHLQHIKPYGRYFTALSQDVESLAKHLRNVQGKRPEIDSSGGQGGEASAEDASIWAF